MNFFLDNKSLNLKKKKTSTIFNISYWNLLEKQNLQLIKSGCVFKSFDLTMTFSKDDLSDFKMNKFNLFKLIAIDSQIIKIKMTFK